MHPMIPIPKHFYLQAEQYSVPGAGFLQVSMAIVCEAHGIISDTDLLHQRVPDLALG